MSVTLLDFELKMKKFNHPSQLFRNILTFYT